MFASIEHSGHLDNSVMVLGYVIMRVALVFQWLRAAKDDSARRRVCLTYAATISIAQVDHGRRVCDRRRHYPHRLRRS